MGIRKNLHLILYLRRLTLLLYKVPGLSRIADLIRKFFLPFERNIIIHDFDGNLLFDCALNEHISSQVFWRGSYSTSQLQFLDSRLKPDWVFFDIGANKGEFALFAAKRLTAGSVIAFEPMAHLCKELENNLSLNHFQQVRVVNKGLGDQNKEVPVFNASEKYDNELNLGTYSIYRSDKTDRSFGKISLTRLDDYVKSEEIERLDMMKIDIEGSELEMLHGAAETITRFRPIILIELNEETSAAAGYHPKEILDYLKGLGYYFKLVCRGGRTKDLQLDKLRKFQNVVCIP